MFFLYKICQLAILVATARFLKRRKKSWFIKFKHPSCIYANFNIYAAERLLTVMYSDKF